MMGAMRHGNRFRCVVALGDSIDSYVAELLESISQWFLLLYLIGLTARAGFDRIFIKYDIRLRLLLFVLIRFVSFRQF